MTATVRPYVQTALMRHDTEGEWVLAGTPTGDGRCVRTSSISASRCGSPVRDNWTILSESQVEISYKAALTATPVTAPCSPDMENEDESASEASSPPPQSVVTSVRTVKSSPKLSTITSAADQVCTQALASSRKCEQPVAIAANVSSDEDFGYYRRKSRVAGNGSNKSRNNRKK